MDVWSGVMCIWSAHFPPIWVAQTQVLNNVLKPNWPLNPSNRANRLPNPLNWPKTGPQTPQLAQNRPPNPLKLAKPPQRTIHVDWQTDGHAYISPYMLMLKPENKSVSQADRHRLRWDRCCYPDCWLQEGEGLLHIFSECFCVVLSMWIVCNQIIGRLNELRW